ncbi:MULTISPECIES: heavy-metal-associated domain-containing protein [Cupriavidus]
MKAATTIESAPRFWSEEPSTRPGRRRIRARIGGLHCSLCTATIEKALGKRPGVDKVAVSLTHEQALIEGAIQHGSTNTHRRWQRRSGLLRRSSNTGRGADPRCDLVARFLNHAHECLLRDRQRLKENLCKTLRIGHPYRIDASLSLEQRLNDSGASITMHVRRFSRWRS